MVFLRGILYAEIAEKHGPQFFLCFLSSPEVPCVKFFTLRLQRSRERSVSSVFSAPRRSLREIFTPETLAFILQKI